MPATTRFPEETGRSRSAIADGTSAPFFFFIARFNDPKPGSVGLGADKRADARLVTRWFSSFAGAVDWQRLRSVGRHRRVSP